MKTLSMQTFSPKDVIENKRTRTRNASRLKTGVADTLTRAAPPVPLFPGCTDTRMASHSQAYAAFAACPFG